MWGNNMRLNNEVRGGIGEGKKVMKGEKESGIQKEETRAAREKFK